MEKLTVGILGCASVAKRVMAPAISRSIYFKLGGVASRFYDRGLEFSKEFNCRLFNSYEELVNCDDINILYVPLPNSFHAEWVLKGLQAGKHVLIEKPSSLNIDEMDSIINLATQKQLCVMENFMFPYHSQFSFIKELLDKEAVGTVRRFKSTFCFPKFDYKSNIRYLPELGGGSLFDAGAYTIKAAQLFMGPNQKVIDCYLQDFGEKVDFQGSITMINDVGIISQLFFGFDAFYQNNIEILGTKGLLKMHRAFTAPFGFSPMVTLAKHNVFESYSLPADDQACNLLKHFYHCIEAKNVHSSLQEIIQQSHLLFKAREASKYC